MTEKIKTTDMTREEWLECRRSGIGGSDAATVCGLNPYGSLISLWADKSNRIPAKEDSEAMRIGRDLEEYVAERFCEATGKKVRRTNYLYRRKDAPFLIANIDREIVGENAALECKTTSVFNKSDFENGEIPLYYLCQCRHYMNVMGYDKMYLAVLVMGKAFYWYEIPYDKAEGDALIALESEFWKNYIISDVRPEPDGSVSAAETIKILCPDKKSDETVNLIDDENILRQYAAVSDNIKKLETEKEKIKQEIQLKLDGCESGQSLNYKVTFKEQSRTAPDVKKLKSDFPQIYEKTVKTTRLKVLRVSEIKNKKGGE